MLVHDRKSRSLYRTVEWFVRLLPQFETGTRNALQLPQDHAPIIIPVNVEDDSMPIQLSEIPHSSGNTIHCQLYHFPRVRESRLPWTRGSITATHCR